MWKTGVHWLMEEGAECMVELVNNSKGVVIITKSIREQEICADVFCRIFICVMEAKAEFCHTIRPLSFLLHSTDEADYLSEDNLFAMSDVELSLTQPERSLILSITGVKIVERSKLLWLYRLTYWRIYFSMDFASILSYLQEVVQEIFELGIMLNIPVNVLDHLAIEFNHDSGRRRRELVKLWLNSPVCRPCWWILVQALEADSVGRKDIADSIRRDFGEYA
jgi:hypothetical protein